MCGIAGIISKNPGYVVTEGHASHFSETLFHRGPNNAGYHLRSDRLFLNRRLAIVGTEGGNQPIYTDDGLVGIVYNGEVYNYPELKSELEGLGYSFKTRTDTEVILKLYDAYGEASFERLNGMFGFCIWDDRKGKILLVRDHIGIKPLYLYEDSDKIIFCSELKGIASLPDVSLSASQEAVQDYLHFRYTQAPLTPFNEVRRLHAGTFLRWDGSVLSERRYWEPSYTISLNPPTFEEAKEEVFSLLKAAVKSQLMGEVPIGVLLSGGVDSSAIAYLLRELGANLTSFNIGFADLNEFEFSRAVAHQVELPHVEVVVEPKDFITDFDEVVTYLDEPIADPACFPLYQLCKELKKQVTVVLSGEGGDELFAGYPQYADRSSSAVLTERFTRFLSRSHYFPNFREFFLNTTVPPRTLRNYKYFQGTSALNSMLRFDMKTWMPDNLMMKADKILMAHSLEGRFPFLDRTLFDFAATLPEHYKWSVDGISKAVLKQAFRGKIPDLVTDRPKMGFSVPVADMLQTLKPRVFAAVEAARSTSLGEILSMKKVEECLRGHYSGLRPAPLQVWTIFILLHWFSATLPNYRSRSWRGVSHQAA